MEIGYTWYYGVKLLSACVSCITIYGQNFHIGFIFEYFYVSPHLQSMKLNYYMCYTLVCGICIVLMSKLCYCELMQAFANYYPCKVKYIWSLAR